METTPAIILKKADGRGSDQILTLLSKDVGKVVAVARGAKKSKKRFFGGLDLFHCGVFEFAPARGNSDLRLLTGLNQREIWENLREDLLSFLLASSIVESAQIFARAEDPDGAKLFPLVYLSLKNLNQAKSESLKYVTFIYFGLNLLEISGFSVIAHGEGIPKVELEWFEAMLARKCAFVPENHQLLSDALLIITEQIQNIAGYPINSFEPLLIQSRKLG